VTQLTFADVHGFCGGFAVGAVQAGMKLVAKVEDETAFGTSLMEANRVFLGSEWQAQAAPAQDWVPVRADVVLGTPPCTGFSLMSVGGKDRGVNASINHCMHDLVEYAAKIKPAPVAVLMESVAQAYTTGLPLMRALGQKLSDLTGHAYSVTHVLQNNLSTGGVTNRRRYFLVLSRVPFGVEVPEVTRLPVVADALMDLEELDPTTWGEQAYPIPANWWNEHLRRADGQVDGHWTEYDNEWVRHLREEIVGGEHGVGWRWGDDVNATLRRYYEANGRLTDRWQRPYRGKLEGSRGKTLEEHLVAKDWETGGFSRSKMWRWDRPGYVITGAGYWGTWHPRNRLYTHREVARIMGFPDSYLIEGAKADKRLYAFWGKGTSVHPARWLCEWVAKSVDGEPGSVRGTRLDEGDHLIDISNIWRPAARAEFGSTLFNRSTDAREVVSV